MTVNTRHEQHPPLMRRPRLGERWRVGKSLTGRWYAGPAGFGVYADVRMRRRWLYFHTWAQAQEYATRQAAER